MTVSKVRLDCVFSDPFGKSASAIMEYLIETDPDQVSDEEILNLVDRRVQASNEDILESIRAASSFQTDMSVPISPRIYRADMSVIPTIVTRWRMIRKYF